MMRYLKIVDNQLRIKTSANYEVQDTYRVQLSITDSSSASVIKNIEFNVTDVAEGVSGSIVDGYVAGATIFQDLDNDNVLRCWGTLYSYLINWRSSH